MRSIICFGICVLGLTQAAFAREQIRVVGSSTVYPFVTVVAEEFGRKTDYRTPVVEATGTGGGLKLFCGGKGEDYPDFANASRKIKASEVQQCKDNKVGSVTEINLGYDGVVLANSVEGTAFSLTLQDIFNALARQVVKDGALVDNPNTYWSDVNNALPKTKISVYGPPPTSGTRDAFVELVMEQACVNDDVFKAAYPNKKARKKQCHLIREDGLYVEAGENDNLIVQKLRTNRESLGIFGYSFLEQNGEIVQAALIEGVAPEFETIADGRYPVSRPLFVYMKDANVNDVPGGNVFVEEMISENAIGEEGYLVFKGLVPLPEAQRNEMRERVKDAF